MASTAQDVLADATDADVVDGVPARFVARPTSTSDTAALLRLAAARGLTVVPRGSATKLSWGQRPERVDIVLDTGGLTGIVDHAAGDLVVRVRAGTPMSTVAEALAPAGQRLALATRLAGQTGALGGTVGGTIAANPSGPLRYGYGTVRDVLIGVTMVRADGAVAHSGGAVVKNVRLRPGKAADRLAGHPRRPHRGGLPAASDARVLRARHQNGGQRRPGWRTFVGITAFPGRTNRRRSEPQRLRAGYCRCPGRRRDRRHPGARWGGG
ncbi:FAD-binding oxidoreductase [Fodinicola feengrottensis]|uniref:FAD-binding oxidoreductase n=1 Tax=Fodinicola feengrottensis TaxID=435914 RepID=UPI002441C3AC|nr:FAD-binding oxidoreductase [Fodinicola feengrottensis]